MRKPVQSNAEEGSLPVFGTKLCLFGTLQMWHEKSLVQTSWAGQGRSSLNSLGSSVLRSRLPNPTKGWNSVPTYSSSAFIGHIEYSAKGGGFARERKKER